MSLFKMKMNYQSDYKRGGKRRSTFSTLTLFSIGLVMVLIAFGLFYILTPALNKGSEGLWSFRNTLFSQIANGDFFRTRLTLENRIKELETAALHSSLLDLETRAKAAAYDNLIAEISSSTAPLAVKIIRKPPLVPYDTLIIDKGQDEGIKKGDQALFGNTVVGVVDEVLTSSARVLLSSRAGNNVMVIIGAENIEAEAVGMGGGFFKVELPLDKKIEVGAIVRGVERNAPLYGVVEYIERNEENTMQALYVSLPIPLTSTEWLTILP